MTKSIIFKVDEKTKEMVEKKARKLKMTISEYLRSLVNGTLESKKNNNPLLKLSSIISEDEANQMFLDIQKDRKNRK
ncbi:MAG: plasmid mobilization protein [Patescibacteria group bacterium]